MVGVPTPAEIAETAVDTDMQVSNAPHKQRHYPNRQSDQILKIMYLNPIILNAAQIISEITRLKINECNIRE